ncbi:MAG: TonB-dependent receptor [Saprospiraceae bacterium]
MSLSLLLLSCISSQMAFGQEVIAAPDTSVELKELVVLSSRDFFQRNSTVIADNPDLKLLNQKIPNSLSDAVARIPGVSQISTGPSISKPVIQGLYGNRLYIGLSGIRFDNQQWQDEHGLGLSMPGISGIQVIKGPASILYGSEAIGGAILIEEEEGDIGKGFSEIGLTVSANGRGLKGDIAYSPKWDKNWAVLRIGLENNADIQDAHENRILNSRQSGYFLKSGLGLQHNKWTQEFHFQSSYSQFGFILEDLNSFFDADSRWTRAMNGPHHNVLLNLLSVQNQIPLKKSTLRVDLGAQSNLRQEDEGGGSISLNMHLLSFSGNVFWEKQAGKTALFKASYQNSFSNNTNYGGRILIPDANTYESNLSIYMLARAKKCTRIELGIGTGYRRIHTFETNTFNEPGSEIGPFSRKRGSVSFMAGFGKRIKDNWSARINLANGYRAANLAEIASNGLHEGVYRYEVGDPNLKTEKNIKAEFITKSTQKEGSFSASTFINSFGNYIYLAPTAESYFGFPVFRYRQASAKLYGWELRGEWTPSKLNFLKVKSSINWLRGQLRNDENLPFISPLTNRNSIRLEFNSKGKKQHYYFEPEAYIAAAQNKPAQFETKTPSYTLLNLYCGLIMPSEKGDFDINLAISNLTNRQYVDHLSRLKYYGISNPGLNVQVSIRKRFSN